MKNDGAMTDCFILVGANEAAQAQDLGKHLDAVSGMVTLLMLENEQMEVKQTTVLDYP